MCIRDSPSTLLYPVSLLIGCWDWVQGGNPLYAAVKCLSSRRGQIWQIFFSIFFKKHMAHPFPTWNFFWGVHKFVLPPQSINQSINVYSLKQPTGFSNKWRLAEPLVDSMIISTGVDIHTKETSFTEDMPSEYRNPRVIHQHNQDQPISIPLPNHHHDNPAPFVPSY